MVLHGLISTRSPQDALEQLSRSVLEAHQAVQPALDGLSKLSEAALREDVNPWSRPPKDVSELRDHLVRAGVRGVAGAAIPGVVAGAAGTILCGSALDVASAPVRAALASVKTPEGRVQVLRNPGLAARAWLVDAPKERLRRGPVDTAVTGIPSAAALGAGIVSAAVLWPPVTAALLSAELVSGAASLAGSRRA